MTARLPAIDLLRWVRLTKLFRQTLTAISMTGEAVEPVILRAVIRLRGLSRQGWFSKPLHHGERGNGCRLLRDRRSGSRHEK